MTDILKPSCVLIDTNIWVSTLMLKNPLGMSLAYTLSRQGDVIALPEVIEMELAPNVLKYALRDRAKVQDTLGALSTLTYNFQPLPLPTEDDILNAVARRISELSPVIKRIAFTLEHAKAALDMVISKLPPNGDKNQQYKDSATWQSLLSLVDKYRVHFITNDHGFRHNRSDAEGLAKNLCDDCRRLGATVVLHKDISSCLDQIQRDRPTVDTEALGPRILELVKPTVDAHALRHNAIVGRLLKTEIFPYRTADEERIALDYTVLIEYEAGPGIVGQVAERRIKVQGSVYLDKRTYDLSGNFVDYLDLQWRSPTGHGSASRVWQNDDPSIPFTRPIQEGFD